MRLKRNTLLLVMIIGFACSASAQALRVILRNTPDSVVIRWAPATLPLWEGTKKYGFRVERLTMYEGMVGKPVPELISTDTVRPWTLDQFKTRFPQDHPYAPAAAQALYGASFGPAQAGDDLRATMDKANDQQIRYTFSLLFADLDADCATALGLRWVDLDLRTDALYQYRVISLDPLQRDTTIVAVNRRNGPDVLGAAPLPTVEELEGRVRLSWDVDLDNGRFTAYWIERSTNGSDYSRVNKRPYLQSGTIDGVAADIFSYTDTTLDKNYVPYHYRLRGISAFGELSPPSPSVTAIGRDRTPPPSPVMKEVKDENGKLVVYWDLPSVTPDLRGFRVEKAPTTTGSFLPLHTGLLPAATRSFTDTSTFLIGENHFRIVAVDTAKNTSVSLTGYGSLVDSMAPSTPSGLSGSIDTLGVVRLHWKVGAEMDLLGYRVFFANATDHEFTNRTGIPVGDTTFIDTIPLKTLTKRIYYRIAAVDRNFNHSDLGAVLTLTKPDIVPPIAPVFAGQAVSDTTVTLRFVPSSSEDVALHRLLRRTQDDTTWTEVASWPARDPRRAFTDAAVDGPAYYSYIIIAMDSAGNKTSAPGTADVRVHKRLRRPRPSGMQGFHDPLSKMVQLNWTAPVEPVKHYILYRSKDGGAMVSVASVEGSLKGYEDKRLIGIGRYDYHLQAVYADGGASALIHCTSPIDVK